MKGSIYTKKSHWKMILSIAGVLILLITMFYSYYLAQELAKKEDKELELYTKALNLYFKNQELNSSFGIEADIILNNDIPLIIEDEQGMLTGNNFGEVKDTSQAFLLKKKRSILRTGFKPIEGEGYLSRLYYTRTKLYDLITYYPYIQILLVASFILFGYNAFQRSRKQEQNLVWAGMAKETAHQLGTPISALIAWIENLKLTIDDNPDQEMIVQELMQDVDRLELIADRFSKIGSVPELEKVNIIEAVNEAEQYMERRSPRRVKFDFPSNDSPPMYVYVNEHLFHWVIENLIRNSLDAMDGQGTIAADIYDDADFVYIDMSDTGKGIPSGKHKTIFQPGYSTKTRGWGLGLSLVKRIIKDYHAGKIFVKKSELGVGTTFTIQLPKKVKNKLIKKV